MIRFESPFHVGRSGLADSYDHVPSFTVYGGLESLRRMGVDHGVSRVSSAFPRVKLCGPDGGPCEEALPAPMPAVLHLALFRRWKEEGRFGEVPRLSKALKGARYLPLDCALRAGAEALGGKVESLRVEVDGDMVRVLCGGKAVKVDTPRAAVLERNTLSRHVVNADVYRLAAYVPQSDFVIYFEGEDRGAFDLLGRLGLGGERSSGLGKFRVVNRGSVPDGSGGGRYALLLGVGRPVEAPRGFLQADYLSWTCGGTPVGPLSVLREGSVVEGEPAFEDLRLDGRCVVGLSPLWVWLS